MNERDFKRCKLEEVIPLDTPFSIFIEPTNLCNFQCEFCPTGDKALLKKFNRPSGTMDYDLYCKIIDDISLFNSKIKKINFYLNGEPLLNKNLSKMIKYAKEKDVAEHYRIRTNGSLLNKENIMELVNSGVDMIGISVDGVSAEDYYEKCKVKLDYKEFVENIKYLYNNKNDINLYIKTIDYGQGTEKLNKFKNEFGEYCDELGIEQLEGWSMSEEKDFTLGQKPSLSINNEPLIKKEVCPQPFYNLAINFDGTVTVCCCDWSYSTIVGDLKKESILEIWNGENLYNFRRMHLEGRRKENRACANCYMLTCWQDNLDSYKEEILSKLNKKRVSEK